MDAHAPFDRFLAVLVGSPIVDTTLHTAAGHPRRVTFGIMSAPISFALRSSAKLTFPEDECIPEQVPLLEIAEERQEGERAKAWLRERLYGREID